MEFSVAEAFDSERIIATADIPGLRLYAVQKNQSNLPLAEPLDLQYPQGWVRSTPETVCGAEYKNNGYDPPHNTSAYCGHHCGPSAKVHSFARATWGYFSAVCFLYGRALLRETGRPQGLIESCWGGTSIESWSDAATLQRCAPPDAEAMDASAADATTTDQALAPAAAAGGGNYNGMIAPFLGFPIRGAIWCKLTYAIQYHQPPGIAFMLCLCFSLGLTCSCIITSIKSSLSALLHAANAWPAALPLRYAQTKVRRTHETTTPMRARCDQ
jgi:hypothetical protein